MGQDDNSVEMPEAVGWDRLRRPVWLFDDIAKRHVYANAAALELWGSNSREEFLGRDCSDQSDATRARTLRLQEVTAGGDVVRERWTFYPNGQPTPADVVISTHFMPCGRAVLMMEADSIHVDVDGARSLEALRHSPCVIGMIDRKGRRVFRNAAGYETFDDDAEVIPEQRYLHGAAARDLFDAAWSGTPSSGLLLARTRRGERWLHTEARRVSDPATGEDMLLLNSQDVTAQVDAEQALAAAADRAEFCEERDRFLTSLSHEMRTPLNTILGVSEVLSLNPEIEGRADLLKRLTEAGGRLSDMLDEVLATSEPRPADVNSEGSQIPADLSASIGQTPPRILFADDHENNRVIVQTMLMQLGAVCDVVENGAQAVEAVRNGNYDLVLMDIQMPVMDGVQAARAIRALPAPKCAVPIVALTANTLDRQVRVYLTAGMNDCIAKPVSIADLLSKTSIWGAQQTAH